MKRLTLIIFIFLILDGSIYSQTNTPSGDNLKILDLSEKVKSIKNTQTNFSARDSLSNTSGKSKGLSIILSIILPGAGHFYEGRMDIGKYFLTADLGLWLSMLGSELYGNSVKDDSRTFASQHSGLSKDGKDDDYFVNVGSFNNIYDYNNDMLIRGRYDQIYDINSKYWNWDLSSNRVNFDEQRKKSERIYNSQKVILTGLVINRIASAVSAYIIANSENRHPLQINSAFIMNGEKIDGVRLNFMKTF